MKHILGKTQGRKQTAMLNSTISLFCLLVPIVLQFFSRRFFIQYLNVELLGVNGAFTSLLSTLSLTELGIQTAVVYCLYQPLKENNINLVNGLMNVMRIIYRWIGIAFIIIPIVAMPFLGYVLKGTEVTNIIRACFFTEALGSAFSYFLAYKRALLYADQKEYVSKLVDLGCNIFFVSLQLFALATFRSFLVFCIINCVRVLISNLVIQRICLKLYPYLKKERFSKEVFMPVWGHVKNIIFLRLSGYVYTSTDNLVISTFVGTTHVGFLGNYTLLSSKLTAIANGMLEPVRPIIGNMLLDKDEEKSLTVFRAYTFIRLMIVTLIIVPFYVVIDDFVAWWLGDIFMLPIIIKTLLIADMFINIYYSACVDYISASGLFKQDKNLGIIGACINIVISIAMVFPFGIAGVLIGTVCSQLFFWVSRSILTFKYSIKTCNAQLLSYWLRAIVNVTIVVVCILACSYIYYLLIIESLILKVVVGVIITIAITIILNVAVYFKTSEFKYVINNFVKNVHH